MSTHEKKWIAALDPERASLTEQKAALAKIGDYMEETYILNLPPSEILLQGLASFAKKTGTAPAQKAAAKRLIKAYRVH